MENGAISAKPFNYRKRVGDFGQYLRNIMRAYTIVTGRLYSYDLLLLGAKRRLKNRGTFHTTPKRKLKFTYLEYILAQQTIIFTRIIDRKKNKTRICRIGVDNSVNFYFFFLFNLFSGYS